MTLIIHPIYAQLQILPINEGNGFVLIKTGEKGMIDRYNYIVHTINLENYYKQLEDLESRIKR